MGRVRVAAVAVSILLMMLLATFAIMSTWAPTTEGASPSPRLRTGITPPFVGLVKASPYKASQGPTGSQYIFSEGTPAYSIAKSTDEVRINVGLVGLPKEKRPRWYLSLESESGLGDLVCHKGEQIWPRGLGEFDDETYIGGCMGTGLGARFNKSAKIEVAPFIGKGDDGYKIHINGRHVGTFTYEDVDHSEDRLIRFSRVRDEYGCIPLAERPPTTTHCER
ncbi:MAG TPA: hypothetical protein VFA32_03050 [Dehalococcoidia bacterium]|jgi:hypothetical protein|nr:hypothetical protein [Dehalococcoidia bacterium]